MARIYTVHKGDTLSKIARVQLGDAKLAATLADFNGLPDPDQIFVGQQIQLPAKREMRTGTTAAVSRVAGGRPQQAAWTAPPHGFEAIRETFGDILDYIRDDGGIRPEWESEHMARAALPFPIPLSWDTSKHVTSIYCHKLVAPVFEAVFSEISARDMAHTIKTYGGCYNYRAKRNGVKPSTHSWGIAIDLNPNTNAMGTTGDMDPTLVDLFKTYGFVWGGVWAGRSKDPMHFQYCSGY